MDPTTQLAIDIDGSHIAHDPYAALGALRQYERKGKPSKNPGGGVEAIHREISRQKINSQRRELHGRFHCRVFGFPEPKNVRT